MTSVLTVSLRDRVAERLISMKPKGKSRSEWVEEILEKGLDDIQFGEKGPWLRLALIPCRKFYDFFTETFLKFFFSHSIKGVTNECMEVGHHGFEEET